MDGKENYDMFTFMLYILIAIFFVIFIFMIITFLLEEDVRKLKRNCKKEEKEKNVV
jgi:phosphotransferase system  glucose/maltose/N-acetylglucosamine-specific IIC component